MDLPKEAYLYWIHCNRCFEIFVHKTRKMYILSCQHISCEKCATKVEGENRTYNCPICNNKVRGCLMGKNLPTHVKELFHPKPWLEGLPTSHILRFQEPHRHHFEIGMQRVSLKAERAKQRTLEIKANVERKLKELENLRSERKKLEKRVRNIIKQRKEKEEERIQKEAELQNHCPSPTTSSDLDFSKNAAMQRHPMGWQRSTIRPRPVLGVNDSRFQNPDNLSFGNFACPNSADFSL